MRSTLPLLLLSFVLGTPILGVAQSEPPAPTVAEESILLPDLAITEKMALRPMEKWRIGQLENLEIFSDASEQATNDFAARLYKFHQAFTYLFPKTNNITRSKVTIILCGTISKFRELTTIVPESNFETLASQTLSDNFTTHLVINLDVKSSFDKDRDGQVLGEGDVVVPLEGQRTGTEFIDGETLVRREYIHLLFSRSRPRPPAWLEEGAARYFTSLQVGAKTITFAKLDREIVDFFHLKRLLSMSELFAITYDSPEYIKAVGSVFSNQSLAFIHYGMFAYKMRHQKAFFEFIDRAAKEPVTEPMFKSIFKMSYQEMEAELRDYVDGGFYRHVEAPKNVDFPPSPTLAMRDATDAEMGRIKGDTLRLVKRYDDARIELISPIMRKHADARLVGSLGVLDYEKNDFTAAQKFLEESVAAKVDQPAPYITLAKLRLEDALRNNPTPTLTATQLSNVLKPLFAALTLKRPPIEAYLLIADAWLLSQSAPSLENLAVLDQGVIAFPLNSDLIYKNAKLKARFGFAEDARSLTELGLKVTKDTDTRKRLAQLQAALPTTK
jgi:hypothetical protein